MTDHVLAAWKEDIEIRTQGLERDFPEHNDTGYKVNAHEIQPGVIYKDGNVTVTAFLVAREGVLDALRDLAEVLVLRDDEGHSVGLPPLRSRAPLPSRRLGLRGEIRTAGG